MPDAEDCLAAAIAAGRTGDLEVAIRFAVRKMATADPDQIDVTEVHLPVCLTIVLFPHAAKLLSVEFVCRLPLRVLLPNKFVSHVRHMISGI